jgi:hypothetical protein
MARKIEVLLVDDLDGGTAEETLTFSLDGAHYEIDLSTENADKLRTALQPFMEKGSRQTRQTGSRGVKPVRNSSNRERSHEIREWAKNQGLKVNERGRIPAAVIEQYQAAH